MRLVKTFFVVVVTIVIAAMLGCSDTSKAPDVSGDIRHALDQAGLNDVSVSQDRDKGVVTLGGKVRTDDDKGRAESIAKSIAGTEVVSDQIGVRPNGNEGDAKKVDSDLDSGIDKNLDAMLVQHRLKSDVRYDVNNGVVTLKGAVPSQDRRASVQKLAEQVPNVKQVVNELEVKHQRASTSK
jgi:hyperosmotically inducible protein